VQKQQAVHYVWGIGKWIRAVGIPIPHPHPTILPPVGFRYRAVFGFPFWLGIISIPQLQSLPGQLLDFRTLFTAPKMFLGLSSASVLRLTTN